MGAVVDEALNSLSTRVTRAESLQCTSHSQDLTTISTLWISVQPARGLGSKLYFRSQNFTFKKLPVRARLRKVPCKRATSDSESTARRVQRFVHGPPLARALELCGIWAECRRGVQMSDFSKVSEFV